MSISFADNILNETPKALDDKTGVLDAGVWRPYNSVSEALSSPKLISGYRYIGLTICILKDGKSTEYWWKSGIADNQLIVKVQGILKTTISEIRSFSGELPATLFYTTDLNKEGNWYYDPLDSSSVDNTGKILVTSDGKVIKRIYERSVNLLWFGAKGTDDTLLIQAAIDSLELGEQLIIPYDKYTITSTITLNKYNIEIVGNKSELHYNYSGAVGTYAFDCGKVLSNIFPVSNIIRDIAIYIENAPNGTKAWGLGCSTSRFDNLSARIGQTDQIGFEIKGDVNGTGSYYNIFTNLRVQGNSLSGQVGIKFSYDLAMASRCPNANTFIGGRVGQCDIAWIINGNGNALYNPTAEGNLSAVFKFSNPDAPLGCTKNTIYNSYIEGADGATAFLFDPDSIGNVVLNPRITSLGVGGHNFIDNGTANEWHFTNDTKVQAKGYVFNQVSTVDWPAVLGPNPGFKFKDANNNELVIRNGASHSQASDFFLVINNDSAGAKTLFKCGLVDAILFGNNLRFRNDLQFGLFSGTATPEGSVIGKTGSVFMNMGGDIGKSAFIKESGISNTGWKPVQGINSGTEANRPSVTTVGYQYFDTTLGKPIWWGGTAWKDATGTVV